MGDKRRFNITAEFIIRNYSKAKSILCVADGKGDLAKILRNSGRNSQVIDPVYNGLYFDRLWKYPCDLIVGLHPDEATAEIVIVGEKLNIPYIIVPCCVKGVEAKNIKGFDRWIKHLKSLSKHSIKETRMSFGGANIVLYK